MRHARLYTGLQGVVIRVSFAGESPPKVVNCGSGSNSW
jgi:hypothetical protein